MRENFQACNKKRHILFDDILTNYNNPDCLNYNFRLDITKQSFHDDDYVYILNDITFPALTSDEIEKLDDDFIPSDCHSSSIRKFIGEDEYLKLLHDCGALITIENFSYKNDDVSSIGRYICIHMPITTSFFGLFRKTKIDHIFIKIGEYFYENTFKLIQSTIPLNFKYISKSKKYICPTPYKENIRIWSVT